MGAARALIDNPWPEGAQNMDVHLLAWKKLMKNEPLDDNLFPEDVQDFVKRYYHQKKDLLFLNKNDI